MTLDVFELCSSELQGKLKPIRDKFKEEDDRRTAEVIFKLIKNFYQIFLFSLLFI